MKSSCLFGSHEMHLWAGPFRSHPGPITDQNDRFTYPESLPFHIPETSKRYLSGGAFLYLPFKGVPPPPPLPWGMTIVFLFCSKGMSLVYSFSGVALWFCVCGSSLRQSGTNQEEFSVYLLAEYHIDCLQLPRLSQSPSLSLSLSRSLLPQKT